MKIQHYHSIKTKIILLYTCCAKATIKPSKNTWKQKKKIKKKEIVDFGDMFSQINFESFPLFALRQFTFK